MTQDERWNIWYDEVKSFVEENHRNPSKYAGEERKMYTVGMGCRKLMNQGVMKEERVEVFKELGGRWRGVGGSVSIVQYNHYQNTSPVY